MNRFFKTLVFLGLLTFPSSLLAAPERDGYRHEYARAWFTYSTGSSIFNPSYGQNNLELGAFRARRKTLLEKPGSFIGKVTVTALRTFADDAPYKLMSARSETMADYLMDELSVPRGLISAEVSKESLKWKELEQLVGASDYTWKEEVLAILASENKSVLSSDGTLVDARLERLKSLREGNVWNEMTREVFPKIDRGGVVVSVEILQPDFENPATVIKYDTVTVNRFVRDTVWVYRRSALPKKTNHSLAYKTLLMEVKTNIVGIPLINVGAEFPIGNYFSAGVDIYYPWLPRTGLHKDCFQLAAFDIEGRFWFPKSKKAKNKGRMLGHSVGVYYAMGLYDFETNWDGHQGDFINVGLDYKYAFPIANGLFRIELELGVGYIYSIAQPYSVFAPGGKAYIHEGIKNRIEWFGPTRAQVNFVWPIFINNR